METTFEKIFDGLCMDLEKEPQKIGKTIGDKNCFFERRYGKLYRHGKEESESYLCIKLIESKPLEQQPKGGRNVLSKPFASIDKAIEAIAEDFLRSQGFHATMRAKEQGKLFLRITKN